MDQNKEKKHNVIRFELFGSFKEGKEWATSPVFQEISCVRQHIDGSIPLAPKKFMGGGDEVI